MRLERACRRALAVSLHHSRLQGRAVDGSLVGGVELLRKGVGGSLIGRREHHTGVTELRALRQRSRREAEHLHIRAGVGQVHIAGGRSRKSRYGDGAILVVVLRRHPIVVVAAAAHEGKTHKSRQAI